MYAYDIELRKHTKEVMKEGYMNAGKSKEWISRALNVDYNIKVRMVDTCELQDKLDGYTVNVPFDLVVQLVKECEVK